MKEDKYWKKFLLTGAVEDYLRYKKNEKLINEMSEELTNAEDDVEVKE